MIETIRVLWQEIICRKIAFALPKHIAYWACLRLWEHAAQGSWSDTKASTITMPVALDRWWNANS